MLCGEPKSRGPRPVGTMLPRRAMLQLAGVQAAGGAIAGLSAGWEQVAAAAPTVGAKARSVIMIFNCGGPSHLDLWDPKPNALTNVRGPFQPISTSVPGIQVTQLLPELARRMDKLAVVRTLHHTHGGHNSGMYWSIVGRPYPVDSTLINPSATDYPSFGTLVGWLAQRDGYSGSVPPYVITPHPHCDSPVYVTPGQYGGCLGVRYDPFVVAADPNAPNFRVRNLSPSEGVTAERIQQRLSLLDQLGDASRPIAHSAARNVAQNQAQAAAITASGDAARAFDLSQEPPAVREKYGRHVWGQSHLLARRLVEAGSRFVSTVNGQSIIWDTHKDNFNQMQNRLVPPMERAFVALLDDLDERGLLDTTLVIWIGDFGRTPIINKDAGRDHWPQCYSAVLAGGGIRGGQVIGESDRTGAFPQARPVRPADLHATVFKLLGYDPGTASYRTADGRPTPLSEGQPVEELCS